MKLFRNQSSISINRATYIYCTRGGGGLEWPSSVFGVPKKRNISCESFGKKRQFFFFFGVHGLPSRIRFRLFAAWVIFNDDAMEETEGRGSLCNRKMPLCHVGKSFFFFFYWNYYNLRHELWTTRERVVPLRNAAMVRIFCNAGSVVRLVKI